MRPHLRRAALLSATFLLLAGCTEAPNIAPPGTSAASFERDTQECRTLADDAVETDAQIDQDIFASRQNDWQRSEVVRSQTRTMHEMKRDRADWRITRMTTITTLDLTPQV